MKIYKPSPSNGGEGRKSWRSRGKHASWIFRSPAPAQAVKDFGLSKEESTPLEYAARYLARRPSPGCSHDGQRVFELWWLCTARSNLAQDLFLMLHRLYATRRLLTHRRWFGMPWSTSIHGLPVLKSGLRLDLTSNVVVLRGDPLLCSCIPSKQG